MKNGCILIIPSGKNHGWIPVNHPLQCRKGIFTGIKLCSAFAEEDVLYYELLRPNETITIDRYQ